MERMTFDRWQAIMAAQKRLKANNYTFYSEEQEDLELIRIDDVDFSRVPFLEHADLSGFQFRYCNFRHVSLMGANLHRVYFYQCDLAGACLLNTNLTGVQFKSSNLMEADFNTLDLSETTFDLATAGLASVCPEEGAFIAFKKIRVAVTGSPYWVDAIAKLEIPAEAFRSSSTTRKCRASIAKVLEIRDEKGNLHNKGFSIYEPSFAYLVGGVIEPRYNFNPNRWEDCASGIHFFMTRQEAENFEM